LKLYKNFITENLLPDIFLTEITENNFKNILDTYCKNFNPNDIPIYRGDNKINGNFYFINPKKRKVNNIENINQYHLYFLDKWDNLPKKSKSSDFVVGNPSIPKYYGKVYRYIPFDNGIFITNGKGIQHMIGTYNKTLEKDNIHIQPYILNKTLDNIVKNYNTTDIKAKIQILNNIFKYKKNDDLYQISKILEKKKLTFEEYMTDIFSPKSYNIKNYNELEYDDIGWTDVKGLLIDYKFSKEYFRPKKIRITKEYSKNELNDIINKVKKMNVSIKEYMKWIKTNYPNLSREDMKFIVNNLR